MKFHTSFAWPSFVALALVCGSGAAGAQSQAPRFKQRVTVQGSAVVKGSPGDHHLTFSGPVALPGVSLPPGTYEFRRPGLDGSVIQVLGSGGTMTLAMFHTSPAQRNGSIADYEVVFGPPLAPGSPATILSWFTPGSSTGRAVIYPQRRIASEGAVAGTR